MESENAFKIWVKELINEHRNPQIKYDLEKKKQADKTPDDEPAIETRLENLKELITTERVELQYQRCIGDWISQGRVVRIRQQTGSKICSIGFQNIEGKYLYPFEALFLLETNRLEILENEVPWTLCRAYSECAKYNNDLEMYKAYRKFSLYGFDIKSEYCKDVIPAAKRFCVNAPGTSTPELNQEPGSSSISYTNIFKSLKEQGPKYDPISIRTDESDTSWSFRCSTDETFDNFDYICRTNEKSKIKQFLHQTGLKIYSIAGSIIEIDVVETLDVPYNNLN